MIYWSARRFYIATAGSSRSTGPNGRNEGRALLEGPGVESTDLDDLRRLPTMIFRKEWYGFIAYMFKRGSVHRFRRRDGARARRGRARRAPGGGWATRPRRRGGRPPRAGRRPRSRATARALFEQPQSAQAALETCTTDRPSVAARGRQLWHSRCHRASIAARARSHLSAEIRCLRGFVSPTSSRIVRAAAA